MTTQLAPRPITGTAAAPRATSMTDRAAFALGPVLVVAVLKTVLQLAVAGRYGWHRDELYYFEAGRHPALGYVDFPPVTPLLARLSRALFGESLVGLRSFAALAGLVVIVLVALTARELGGGRSAQVMAAILTASCPFLLGSNALFQTVSFDQLAWAATLFVLARLVGRDEPRLWPVVGVLLGMGLMTKYTIALLPAAAVIGLVCTRTGRRQLGRRGPWLAAGVAALIVLPNLWWQTRHGWPSVDFFVGRGRDVDDQGPIGYVFEVLLLTGFVAVPICVAGFVLLARDRRFRPLAPVAPLVIGGFLLAGGKSYYALPVVVLLYAAGAVAVERAVRHGRSWLRFAVPAALAATLITLPLALPAVDEATMVDWKLWEQREDYAEQIGWPELTDAVARAYVSIPPARRADTAILTRNYGEAGAVDLYGPERGLPGAVSGHLGYGDWVDPGVMDATTLVTVGYSADWLDRHCDAVARAGRVRNDAGVPNEEWGAPIAVCELDGTLAGAWPDVRTGY